MPNMIQDTVVAKIPDVEGFSVHYVGGDAVLIRQHKHFVRVHRRDILKLMSGLQAAILKMDQPSRV